MEKRLEASKQFHLTYPFGNATNGYAEPIRPLPLSKHTRVRFEAIRTVAAISQVTINSLIALRLFGYI